MGDKLLLTREKAAAPSMLACLFAAILVLTSALATAQDAASPSQKALENEAFDDARKKVEGFGRNAGDAAKTTVQGAKDAAGAVARIPAARAISGHEKCQLAPNGAPDCVAAANTMCKAKGFDSGSSLDMTTAEVCPPKVYMSGRTTGPECNMETFVSRAFCQ